MRARPAILALAGLSVAVAAVHAAAIFNGSFEEGTVDPDTATVGGPFINLRSGSTAITGWTVFRGEVDYTGSLWPTEDGTRSVDLNGFQAGGIRQDVATVTGQQYLVTFKLAGNPFGGPSLKTVRVTAAGQSRDYTFDISGHSTASAASMGWRSYAFAFTAIGATTTLMFESLTTTGGFCSQSAVLEDGSVAFVSGPACFGPMIDQVAIRSGPTAVAGADQSVHAGQLVTLDGTASFDDDTASEDLAFSWLLTAKPEGSTAELSVADTATPSFIVDLPGDYTAILVVTDDDGLSSSPDAVAISSLNSAPIAHAGPDQGALVGSLVTLDGSASLDPDDDPFDFSWTLAAPPGSTAVLAGATTAFPTFVPNVSGTFVATLIVTDPFGGASSDAVQLSVITGAEFTEIQTMNAINAVAALTPAQVTNKGNQQALQQLLAEVLAALRSGNVDEAREKLTQVVGRTDGCVLRGAPDGNGAGRDWVIDCAAQETLYAHLTAAIEALDI